MTTLSERSLRGRGEVVRELLAWFRGSGRWFSFRKTSDPYLILVSEILLRQTRAAQVESVFPEFIRRYPTVQALASSSPKDLHRLMRPLGMKARNRQLVAIAKSISFQHQGQVPADVKTLQNLPGIGKYIASCVRSFSYGIGVPQPDVNVTRVVSRLFGLEPRVPQDSDRVAELYQWLSASTTRTRDLHYAVIDLAHVICRPKEPDCPSCPLIESCQYAETRGVGGAS